MRGELSQQVVEWVFAGWAGHPQDPEKVYPSLQDANFGQLNAELNQAIHEVTDARAVVTQ